MFERIEFQGKLWKVCAKVDGSRVDDPSTLKKSYRCDLVLKAKDNIFYILDEIIDAEFEELG